MADKTYNGWTNYETWAVSLWLTNERATSEPGFYGIDAESYPNDAADSIKQFVEDCTPDLGASVYADLLNAALSEVNYYEIADYFIEEAKKASEDDNA